MKIGRILYPVHALGPGERLGIWVQGCNRRCIGCANPEFWDTNKGNIPIQILISLVNSAFKHYQLDGITISGGEPMQQAGDINSLLNAIKPYCNDVLLYTGYSIEELRQMGNEDIDAVLQKVAVIVDGPYIKELNKREIIRGSSNQHIHILRNDLRKKYEEYMQVSRHIIDNFIVEDGIISVGIHPDGIIP